MARPVLAVCSLLLLVGSGGLVVVAEPIPPVPATTLPEPGGAGMEGIALGESFRAVDARLNFRNVLPLVEGEGRTVYRWPPFEEAVSAERVEGAQQIRSLEIVFEEDVVVEIRSSYQSRTRYARMGPGLIARYGEPTVVRAGPPRRLPIDPRSVAGKPEAKPSEPVYRVPEARTEKPQYLWVELWVWEWEGATLQVTGEHYTEDPKRVEVGLHVFRFRLTSRSGGD